MPEKSFNDFRNQIFSLTYEQSLALMAAILENLKSKVPEKTEVDDLTKLDSVVAKSSMNSMWEELKNDT